MSITPPNGGELQRARARQLVRSNPYASNAAASFAAHAVGCGIKPSSLVEDPGLKDRIQRLWRRHRSRSRSSASYPATGVEEPIFDLRLRS